MLRRPMTLALTITLFALGCNGGPAATDPSRGTCRLDGAIERVPEFYNVVVTVRGIDNDRLEQTRLIGTGRPLSYRFTHLPPGRYDVFAELEQKPKMPEPPADHMLLDPVSQAVAFDEDGQRARANFEWLGHEDAAPRQLPRGYTWGVVENVPSGHDVILTLKGESHMRRIRLSGMGSTRRWRVDELPPDSYTVTCDLYHHDGARFAPPGTWEPERIISNVFPGLRTRRVIMAWQPIDPGDAPGRIRGAVRNVPSGHDAVVVAERDGLQWKAYASGLFSNTYNLDKLPPGAYVVSVKFWDRNEQRWTTDDGQFAPHGMIEVLVPENGTVRNIDFTWTPDIF